MDSSSQTEMVAVAAAQVNGKQIDAENDGYGEETAITNANKSRRASARKIATNRRNARKSTGPRTIAGKRRSSRNAVRHGVLARYAVITVGDGKEDQTEFDELHQKLREYYQPDGIQDELDVEELALGYWRKSRAVRAEVGAIRGPLDTFQQNEARSSMRSVATEKMSAACLPLSADNLWSSSAGVDYLLSLLEKGQISHLSAILGQLGLQPLTSKHSRQQIASIREMLSARRSEVAQAEALSLSAQASELAIPSIETINKLIRYTTANDRRMDQIRDRLEKGRTERMSSSDE